METPQNPTSTEARSLAPLVAPVISLSSPASGLAGATVTLTGSGFTNVTAVTFGAVAATSFVVSSATRITAVAPPGAGSVQIVVTTTSGASNGVGFTYTTATPVIGNLTPGQGSPAGGNTVTLTGTGFTGVTAVHFGATSVPFTVLSPTQATATAPPGAPGTVNVTITAAGGTSAGLLYFYTAAAVPTLTSVTPNHGPLTGGNTVTLTGTGFTGATAVTFGGVAATSFTVVSATQITAVVPAGSAAPAAVVVVTPGGATPGDVFYYHQPVPVLTALTPTAGSTAGGTTVTLTGTGFVTATAVRFGAVAATFTVVSDTQITAVAPPGVVGPVTVTVVTPGGTSNGLPYTYGPAPVLTAVTPNTAGAGALVTLTGSGLTLTGQVLFGAVPASFSVISDSIVTASVPPGPAGPVSITVVTSSGTSNALPFTLVLPPGI